MQAKKMFSAVEANTREYEAVLRDHERADAANNARELSLRSEIAACLSRVAAVQLDSNLDVHSAAAAELRAREVEESELRAELAKVEAKIENSFVEQNRLERLVESTTVDSKRILGLIAEVPTLVSSIDEYSSKIEQAKLRWEDLTAECERKLPAYAENPLYCYLVASKYGSEQYDRAGLARSLDRWVARLCDFEQNRANHLTLLAMSAELQRGPAGDYDSLLKAAAKKLAQHVSNAELNAGVPRAKEALEKHVAQQSRLKASANDLHSRIKKYVDRTDQRYARAKQLISDSLANRSSADLVAFVSTTASPEDDVLVTRLVAMRAELDEIKSQRPRLIAQRDRAEREYDRAKSLERSLRSNRYDSGDYEYGGGLDINSMLVGYMAGQLSDRDASSTIGRYRREVPQEVFVSTPTSSTGTSGSYGGWASSTNSSDSDDSYRTSSGSDSDSGSYSTDDSF